MCCPFEATTMDKQICFVLLSCMFATVYLQESHINAVMDFVAHELHHGNQHLLQPIILVFESFTVMSQKNYLVQVRATNINNEAFVCTVIVKIQSPTDSLAVTDKHCSDEQPGSEQWGQYIDSDYFQKTVKKAVDVINHDFGPKMTATSLKEVKLTVDGQSQTFVFTFEMVVAKTSCFNIPGHERSSAVCRILTDNQASSRKYFVKGKIVTWAFQPWIETLIPLVT